MIDESIWTDRMHQHVRRTTDYRSPYDVDYSRVAHSMYYRKLGQKTQILSVSQDGDYARNRLTHTIEVGQISLGLITHLAHIENRAEVRAMIPNRPLMTTIAAVHDIGHPPYGHGGEVALNYAMRGPKPTHVAYVVDADGAFVLDDKGEKVVQSPDHMGWGFEGNGQTLRILSRLLEGSSTRPGGNLTRRTLLGALKYPVPYHAVAKDSVMIDGECSITGRRLMVHKNHEPPKCYLDTEIDVVDWLLSPLTQRDRDLVVDQRAKSFDCSIMDLADDFAYGPGDLEDAITLGLVTRDQLTGDTDPALWDEYLSVMSHEYPHDYQSFGRSRYEAFLDSLFGLGTKEECGRLIHYMISNSYVEERPQFEEPMYRYRATVRPVAGLLLKAIKKFVKDRVIRAPEVQQLRFKGQQMIIDIFSYYRHDPRHLLPTPIWEQYNRAEDDRAAMRVICDFVATMTDTGMEKAHARLFSPGVGSVFDSLR